ncbi:uncharacterized protein PHACADRAFT_28973 [Phanerochaete carnosa HHB-10118-sp]|uniref:F-box domain-containing protein n=1 Tax=Phanerochaete carnosa (strain HHB-10118-sp) TaxID=650164 RepID=K5WAJ8_PHACS|nr:uncharacterized protein PHACADRAFT_28973 [Phanerochaete carnosa HHB-10118-sp]EKM55999.1 hypothetical protein PHACADRAFT_28973 [Phanerochaete carnosa HHB-10118-sp]
MLLNEHHTIFFLDLTAAKIHCICRDRALENPAWRNCLLSLDLYALPALRLTLAAGRGLRIYLKITLICEIFVCSDSESSPLRVQENLAAYDAELAKIRDLRDAVVAASLRFRAGRNSCVKITTLPTEVLRQIFCLAVECGLRHQTNFAIAATCARWRTVAFGESCTWTHLPLTKLGISAYDFYKARNRCGMPLTVTIHDSWPIFLNKNAVEVQAFHAVFSQDKYYEKLFCKLQLINTIEFTIHLPERPWRHVLSDSIFQDANRLQYLTLRGCRFSWDSKCYGPNLLELRVEVHGPAASEYMSGKEGGILQIFRASPRLRKLELELHEAKGEVGTPSQDYALSIQDQPDLCHTRIEMDWLRSITLDLPFEYATHILESISLPVETMARFELTVHDSRSQKYALGDILGGTRVPLGLFAGLRELRLHDLRSEGLGMRGLGLHQRQFAIPEPYTFSVSHWPSFSASLGGDGRMGFFPELRALVPQMVHLEHLIFRVCNGVYSQASLAKEDARSMASLVPEWTPRLRKITFDGCQPVLLDALRERLADAFATSLEFRSRRGGSK